MDNLFVKHYGEYSLRYWIRLLLKSDITLPSFQRLFVWEKEQVESFIHSIDNKQFVPPVIIGNYIEGKKDSNWILDGQQRLCSLLFAYIGMYPKINEFKINDIGMPDGGDEEDDAGDEERLISSNYILDYIQKLTKNNGINDRLALINKIETDGKFQSKEKGKIMVNDFDGFFDNNYLPFIYIKCINKCDTPDEVNNEKEYYANLFYNINAKGTSLSVQESRNAILWFLGKEMRELLGTELKINISGKDEVKDIVVYLAIISFIYHNYKENNDTLDNAKTNLLRGYSGKVGRDQFALDFINNINNKNYIYMFGDFSKIFKNCSDAIKKVRDCINSLNTIKYNNIAEFEIRFFGMLYWQVFCKNVIDIEKCNEEIERQIDSLIYKQEKKDDYTRNVNTLRRIRDRVKTSIEFYKDHCKKIGNLF